MSLKYTWVQWNKYKKIYDLLLAAGIALYVIAYVLVSSVVYAGDHGVTEPILVLRAFGSLAMIMLTFILMIGPLARMFGVFSPLLYNRRHFGVAMFHVGLIHGALSILFYHGFGVDFPLVSLFKNGGSYTSYSDFPFQVLGFIALTILFFMMATSHDFWLKNLKPGVWKALHMLVYIAYALLVLHIIIGPIQTKFAQDDTPVFLLILSVMGPITIVSLHLMAGVKENLKKREAVTGDWVDIGTLAEIPENRAKAIRLNDQEPIAVYKYDGKLSAVAGVCVHQQGPLAEGKIIKGCITCPWHGYQYRAEDGCSPPPYNEKIATYELRVEGERVLLNPKANEPGTPVEPVLLANGGA